MLFQYRWMTEKRCQNKIVALPHRFHLLSKMKIIFIKETGDVEELLVKLR